MAKFTKLHEWAAKRSWVPSDTKSNTKDIAPHIEELQVGCLMNITDSLNKQNELLEKQNELLNKQNEMFDKYFTEIALKEFRGS